MKKLLTYLIRFLAALTGLVFLFSAYTKLDPVIETFEMIFVRLGIGNWTTAPWIARGIIGLEILTGFLLLINYRLKRTALWAIVFLMMFNVYLLYQIFSGSGEDNCGCFGEVIKMSPSMALLKNIIMIAVLIPALLLNLEGWNPIRFRMYLFYFLVVLSFSLPFILNPVYYDERALMIEDDRIGKPLPMELFYEKREKEKVDSITVDFRKGKHVIAFLSLTCPHCRIAGKKISLMHDLNPSIPFYLILNGDRENLPVFFKETHCDKIPYSFVLGRTFVQFAGTNLPRILITDNGNLKMIKNHVSLDQKELEAFLSP